MLLQGDVSPALAEAFNAKVWSSAQRGASDLLAQESRMSCKFYTEEKWSWR